MALTKVKGSGLATGAATDSLVGIDDNATSTAITIDSAENVGIGTTAPSGKTHSVAADVQVAVMAGGDVSDPLYPAFGFDGQIGSNGGRGAGMYLPTDNTLAFSTTGTEKLRIQSGGGISFNGDTAAANALDDYEEGTWTATLRGGGAEPATLITADTASYTKIGDLVTVVCRFSNKNTAGYSGLIEITGMPFSSSNAPPVSTISHAIASWTGFFSGEVVSNKIVLLDVKSSTAWGHAMHVGGTGSYLYASVTFKV